MNPTSRPLIMQRWTCIEQELFPELRETFGALTPRLEKLIHVLDWVRIEEYVGYRGNAYGRPESDRGALANAFVAKAVLGLPTTVALMERLAMDRALRRICGFPVWKKQLPSESTFSRAFDEFAQSRLAERVHEAVIKTYLGDTLIGHISRDGTAIEARERPQAQTEETQGLCSTLAPAVEEKPVTGGKASPVATHAAPAACDGPADKTTPEAAPDEATAPAKPARRGRPRKGEAPRTPKMTRIQRQRTQTLPQMLADLPKACDRGSKCNAQGYKNSWNGYKLHIDTADCGVPISALLSSASLHDSQAAIPLATMTASRVTNCYDLMDAAYCSEEIRAHSRQLGHIPLIDHNPRGGEKIPFLPHEAQRYRERSQAERTNARLKDEFGGNAIWVRGPAKVMSHLMFGLLVLTVDQLMRVLT